LNQPKVIEAIHASASVEALGVQPRPSKDDDLGLVQKRIYVSLALAVLSPLRKDLLAQVYSFLYL